MTDVSPPTTSAGVRKLLKQFLPLSVSDVTMACGDPMITMTIAHLPNATLNLGALGAGKAVAVFFESPVIMLLHASNAFAPWNASRAALKRFMILSSTLLSATLAVLCIPSVFNLTINSILNLPPETATLASEVLVFFILWPAAIAWRRYYQGLLIRYHCAKSVAAAGFLRLGVVALILAVGFSRGVPGLRLAGQALIIGVIAEATLVMLAAYVFRVTRPALLDHEEGVPANLAEVWKSYRPLASSMMVVWGGRALLVAIIARSWDSAVSLAAWPAGWGLVLVVANATRMIQQVVIKNRGAIPDRTLSLFAGTVGLAFSGILGTIAFSPAGYTVISAFVGSNATLINGVTPVIAACAVVPLLVAVQNALQGFLMCERKTSHINVSTSVATLVLLGVAMIAVYAGRSGSTAASVAMVLSLVVEISLLYKGLNVATASRGRTELKTNLSTLKPGEQRA